MSNAAARRTTEEVVEAASTILRTYMETGRNRTDLLRDLAVHIVDLRSRCTLTDGRTDWSGWSSEYRDLIGAVYRTANVPPKLRNTVQSALRYHVGNRLREVAPADELEAVNLTSTTPKERVTRNRERVYATASQYAAAQALDVEPLRVLADVHLALQRLDLAALATIDAAARAAVETYAQAAHARYGEVLTAISSDLRLCE